MRLLTFGLLCLGLLVLSGCGKDPALTCADDSDCDENYQCLNERCELKFLECVADDDCGEEYLRCSDNNTCEERTSCETNDQCMGTKVCASGTCVERQCQTDVDCSDPAQRCIDNICADVPLQCARAGDSCDLNRPNRLGFGCADLGSGPTCYVRCEQGERTNA
ncbi:MAG: hypothetical protein ACNA8W_25760, partial [Bradymonadaceae bacterium]